MHRTCLALVECGGGVLLRVVFVLGRYTFKPFAFFIPSDSKRVARCLSLSCCMVLSCVGGAMSILSRKIPEGRIIVCPIMAGRATIE